MSKAFKKGENKTIAHSMKLHHDLLKKFIKLHGEPVLVHSPSSETIFKKILKEEKIKLPSQHKQGKKAPYMEKLLGLDNTIYYSLGFAYATRYEFKYGLLFDLKYLKNMNYYNGSVIQQCCKEIIKYWDKHDKKEIDKLANKNKTCKQVINTFYNQEYMGRTKIIFEFWKIEKELYDSLQKCKDKKKIIEIMKKTKGKSLIKYPYSKAHAKRYPILNRVQEIISKKQANLKTNPHFIGFYIEGKIPKNIQKTLEKDYKGKMIFNGKEIRKIK